MGPVLAVLVAGCAASPAPPRTITRTVGGERRTGEFVSPYAYEQYIRGELAAAQGNLQAAAERFRMARTGPSDDAFVVARLAEVLDELGEDREARAVLAEGDELDPESEAVWLARARIAERHERFDAAIAAYERAERAAPQSELAPLALAGLLRARDAPGRADAVLRRFLRRVGPRSPEALRARLALALVRGDADAATRAVEQLLRVAPARTAEVEDAVRLALDRGRPVLALEMVERLPRSPSADLLRVHVLLALRRRDRAESLLATLSPDDIGGMAAQAELYLQAGRADRAEEIAAAAASIQPDPDALRVLGMAQLAQGHATQAAETLSRVPPGTAASLSSRLALARALAAAGRDGLAREVLATTQVAPDTPDVERRIELARLRADSGDLDGALAELSALPAPLAQAVRAEILELAGQTDDAIRLWASVGDRADELPEPAAARARAEAALAAGDSDEAIELLRARADRAPEDFAARTRLAELLSAADHDDAAATAREVLALRPEPAYRDRLQRLLP